MLELLPCSNQHVAPPGKAVKPLSKNQTTEILFPTDAEVPFSANTLTPALHSTQASVQWVLKLTLRLLMSYIYGAPSKARNANVVYIWTYVWQR